MRGFTFTRELREAVDQVREAQFVGLNLTIPHKVAAVKSVDRLDETRNRSAPST